MSRVERLDGSLARLATPSKATNQAVNRFMRLFVERFRSDPDAAMAELGALPDDEKSEFLKILLSHPVELDEIPFLKLKLSHFSGFDFSKMDTDLLRSLAQTLANTDPSGVAAAIRGEVPSVDSKLFLDSLVLLRKGSFPRNGDISPDLASAVVEKMLGSDGGETHDRRSIRNFKNALTLLDKSAIASLAMQVQVEPEWFEKSGQLVASLMSAVAEVDPEQALAMANNAGEGSIARNELVRALSSQGFEPAELEERMGDSTATSDLIAYSEGKLAHALGQREGAASITAEIEKLNQIAGENENVKAAVFSMVDQSFDQPGDISDTFEGLLNSEGILAAEATHLLVDKWAKTDPVGLSQALFDQLDSPGMSDRVLMPFISQIRDDPEAVILWAVHIKDEASRTQVIEAALQTASAEEAERLRSILQQ